MLVSLRSTPPGALVVVGGKEFGPTPTQLEWSGADAALGREVTFRFQRKGYRDLTVTRQIRGDRLEVEAPPMDPIPVRRPTREERPAWIAPQRPRSGGARGAAQGLQSRAVLSLLAGGSARATRASEGASTSRAH